MHFYASNQLFFLDLSKLKTLIINLVGVKGSLNPIDFKATSQILKDLAEK